MISGVFVAKRSMYGFRGECWKDGHKATISETEWQTVTGKEFWTPIDDNAKRIVENFNKQTVEKIVEKDDISKPDTEETAEEQPAKRQYNRRTE